MIFDQTTVFRDKEERSYLFWLKPVREGHKLDNTKEYALGMVDFKWRNLYGDLGSLRVGPYKNDQQRPDDKSKIDI